jgi:hypothetical protein
MMEPFIFYTTSEIGPDMSVYIHIPQHGIEIKVAIPRGHDLDDLDLAWSLGDGWNEIQAEKL